MTRLVLVLALVLQVSIIRGDDIPDVPEEKNEVLEPLPPPEIDEEMIKDFNAAKMDWIDMFLMSDPKLFPTSSISMMSQATESNNTLEEQLTEIKEVAKQINLMIENEMINLLSYAMSTEKEKQQEEGGQRKRRCVETPMDSTQMVMRLLNHIKSNNEYQNIAIEKMMTAKEIADKFGIEFNPDPEILSDLAIAANEHARDLTDLLKDTCDVTNGTEEIEFVPLTDCPAENETYYVYSVHPEDDADDMSGPLFEYMPDLVSTADTMNHIHNHPETQVRSPPVHHHHHSQVSPRPTFYDVFPFVSSPDMYTSPYISIEPFTTTYILPIEDLEPEPEIVGEEIEETITTKLFVEKGEEPGSSTVNHVTTYTIAEKSFFKKPQIERLPQHFQYCFYLM